MSVRISNTQIKFKDEDGTYKDVNAISPEIPVATDNSLGVVKGKYYGVKVNASGELYVSKAEINSEVKPGTSNYLPIVPSNQHAAAFYGLAKAAGVDMASSSNAVGEYTDEAKKAICEMLGIPNFDSELIYDGTTTEDLESVLISTDNNGLPFELRACKVFVKLPASTTGKNDYITLIGTARKIDGTTYAQYFPTMRMITSSKALMIYEFEAFPGGMHFIRGATSADFGSSSNEMITMPANNLLKSVCNFRIKQYSEASTLIPSGTRIIIQGIRI